ncbi:hypothetical protein HPP92_028158, partial [Vanilla planifolia]
ESRKTIGTRNHMEESRKPLNNGDYMGVRVVAYRGGNLWSLHNNKVDVLLKDVSPKKP